jgi:hypothetical protein
MSRYPHIPDKHLARYEKAAAVHGPKMTARDKANYRHRFLESVDQLWRDHPLCSVCGYPMTAGQKETHLSCRDNQPTKRKKPQ